MPRKGKTSTIRYKANSNYKQESTREREARIKRWSKIAEAEREANRPPRIKRNGKLLDR